MTDIGVGSVLLFRVRSGSGIKLSGSSPSGFGVSGPRIHHYAKAVTERKVHLSIIHTANKTEDERYDTIDLLKLDPDLVSVRSIHMPTLIQGLL